MNKIFTVTTIGVDDPSTEISFNNHHSRCVGYYFDKEIAFDRVKNNNCDIYECGCYPYVVIEAVEPGIYKYAMKEERWWFKWDNENEEYKSIDDPEFAKNICGFGIG